MEAENIGGLLSGLVCLAPFCLGVMGLAAAAGLLLWLIRRQTQPEVEASLAVDRDKLTEQVAGQVGKLRPWTAGALADLSTDWDATWSRFGRVLRARGTIPGLAEPKEPPWVAFGLKVRGARQPTGQLTARTSQRHFDYHLAPESVEIRVDGALLGWLQGDGTLLDAEGQAIGRASRPGGQPAIFRLGAVARMRDERERVYPVTLSGRVVAHLAQPPIQMLNVVSLTKRPFAPAVTLDDRPTEAEATWLLALAILQVAGYNLLETVWTN